MQKIIDPSHILPDASVSIPSSKSLSHRALIAAALAEGTSVIDHLSFSEDTKATMGVLSHLGAVFQRDGDKVTVNGISSFDYDGYVLDCGESGSTLRFLIPLFSLTGKEVIFTGHGRLMKRPQSVYQDIFHQNHLLFDFEKNTLHISGPLPAGNYVIPGNVSSQFISGLLFALPLLRENSSIEVTGDFESRSYVDLTLAMLKKAGIVINQNNTTYTIPGTQRYRPFHYSVDGDDSQAAFFALLGLVQKEPIVLHHLNHDSQQGDHALFHILKSAGAGVKEIPDGYEVLPGELHGTVIDLADCPDLGPAMFALAAQCSGETTFVHAGRLRIKESDRIAAMEEELRKMGVQMISDENTVVIQGSAALKGNISLSSHHDHRIAMALSMLASIADGPVTIEDADAVNKSYPDFFEDLSSTGVKTE